MTRSFWIKVFSTKFMKWFMGLHTNQIVLLTFLMLITTGTILFMLPFATTNGEGLSFINALFTATSASCVTGLTVVDAKNDLTGFGQFVLILLIQAGGLGIMTFTTLVSVALGKRINLKERLRIQESLNQDEPSGVIKLAINVIKYTLAIEFVFGVLLTIHFWPEFGTTSISYGFFHAISAFCNAGFDLMGDYNSFVNYSSDIQLNLIFMILIIVGSMGFTVLEDLRIKRFSWHKLTLHSKLVLIINSILIFGGGILIWLFEYSTSVIKPGQDDVLISLFQSITARTAGFNTVDLASLNSVTQSFIGFLMFIGASPTSTGGGIKTTTFLVIVLFVWATLRGGKEVIVFDRSIPQAMIAKATTIFTLSIIWVILAFFMLLIANGGQHPYHYVLFETISAFATVGLGIGITNDWNVFGKLILVLTMFIGRVGIITFVLSWMRQKNNKIKYPHENIMIG